ncbi:MAG: DUF1553 domain-containing protein [Planctomycetes bacterium]|nr:DUF1553 domain-containing protein [Planctomycetota bacterium]
MPSRPAIAVLAFAACAGRVALAAEPVVFGRDVRPVLAEKCFACHGPDVAEAKGDLRLDSRAAAVGEPGKGAIVPGEPDQSELVRRILSTDPDDRMPPPESHKTLSADEIDVLRRWIDEGAEYADHWAFLPPVKAPLPAVRAGGWVRNPIDVFVLAALEEGGMEPAPEADRATLVRRVSLDLRGLPPTLAEIDEYLADDGQGSYERMVERMLASPHYGEKMALVWKDLARHGDTSGYHFDSTRDTWPWRDWVIAAYNDNMPFDRFSIEQLAGDLLPDASTAQRIASGFNRNARFNEEGGADPDEWLVRYAIDRTTTLGRVWLGLTLNCAECHSHKYDPVSQREFYSLYAFFNSLEEVGAGGMHGFHNRPVPPVLRVPLEGEVRHHAAVAEADAELESIFAKLAYEDPGPDVQRPPVDETWVDDDVPRGAKLEGNSPWRFVTAADGVVFRGAKATVREADGVSQHYFTGAEEPLEVGAGDRLYAHVFLDAAKPAKQLIVQWYDAGGSWEHRAYWGENLAPWGQDGTPSRLSMGPLPAAGAWVRLEVPAAAVGLAPGSRIRGMAFGQAGGKVHWDAAGIRRGGDPTHHSLAAWRAAAASDERVPVEIRALVAKPAEARSAAEDERVRRHYLRHVCTDTRGAFAAVNARIDTLHNGPAAHQPVSVELPEPRPAHLLVRGDFQQPAERVERDVPAILPPLPTDAPRNRLTLARWLFDPAQPLTARVTVNRLWAQVFGRGVVETIGDFGRVGRYPSHPELLDWLAVEFRESGWDTKHLLRLLLTSSTYRQAATGGPRYAARDPGNVFLSRAPRYRLMAEEIRDAALRTSGLLVETVGGPPVYPVQPADYYAGKQGSWRWNQSQGADGRRRGLYTFWRRTTPYPSFVIFDAPDRSECTVERPRTNTPLQALTTLNDPQFVAAARAFAADLLATGPDDDTARLSSGFRRATARPPEAEELAALHGLLDRRLAHYRGHADEARALAGEAAGDPALLAAWTNVANAILNLDEFIVRQ